MTGLAAVASIGHSFGTALAEAAVGAGLTIFALFSPGIGHDLAASLAGVLLGMGAIAVAYALPRLKVRL